MQSKIDLLMGMLSRRLDGMEPIEACGVIDALIEELTVYKDVLKEERRSGEVYERITANLEAK